jgi:hypothetical protein
MGGVTILPGVFAPTELREKGILLGLVLLPWSQIQSYQWAESNKQILLLNLRQPLDLDFRKQLRIRINPHIQPDVDRVFHLKLNPFN